MALTLLSSKFKNDLIAELRAKGHSHSNKLADSIVFKLIRNGDMATIEFSSLSYIKYLEGGTLIKNFLDKKKKELIEVIQIEIKKDILGFLNLN